MLSGAGDGKPPVFEQFLGKRHFAGARATFAVLAGDLLESLPGFVWRGFRLRFVKVVYFQPGVHCLAVGQKPGFQRFHRDKYALDARMRHPLPHQVGVRFVFQVGEDNNPFNTGMAQALN